MNYFAHGLNFLDDPFFLIGTAVPDLLSIVDRRVRARSRLAAPYVTHANPTIAAVAAGIVRHHYDDGWFHQTRAFAELSLEFTAEIRRFMPDDDGFRPSFLGHILVEILLDSVLIEDDPAQLDRFYRALDSPEPAAVGATVQRMATGPVPHLPRTIQMFRSERFLYDYPDDVKLLGRLNRVMRRVRLPELSASVLGFLPNARHCVRERRAELMAGALPQIPGENHEIRNEPASMDRQPGRRDPSGSGADQSDGV